MIIGHIYKNNNIYLFTLLFIYLFCFITVTTETESKFCTDFPPTVKSYQYHLLYIYLLYSYYIGPTLYLFLYNNWIYL